MHDGGPTLPDGKGTSWRIIKGAEEGPGNRTRPRAFLGDTRGDFACRVCRVTLQLGHRAARVAYGQG